MALYRTVEPRAWRQPDFARLGGDAQLLLLFLATGPLSGRIPGVVTATRAGLAEELGWTAPRMGKALKVCADAGHLRADWAMKLVWVPWALSHARVDSPSSVQGWADAWEELPVCGALAQIHAELGAWLLSRPWGKDSAGAAALLAKVREAWEGACPCPPCAPSGWEGYPTTSTHSLGTHPTPSGAAHPQAPTPLPTPLDTPTPPTQGPGSRNRKQEQEQETEGVAVGGPPPGASEPTEDAQLQLTPPPQKPTPRSQVAANVFAAWVETWQLGSTYRLTPDRERVIAARLKEGFSEADLVDAVRGSKHDPWKDRAQHNDLVQLLKPANVPKFAEWHRKGVGPAPAGYMPARPREAFGEGGVVDAASY